MYNLYIYKNITETKLMTKVLMPRATAVWLIDNTSLSFEQIATFCSLHIAEIQAIADGQSSVGLQGSDPIINKILTEEEIKRCENDPSAQLKAIENSALEIKYKMRKKYTLLSKRKDRPEAILWLITQYPNIKDIFICKLLSTTKNTILSIRNGTYKDFDTLVPRSPVQLGLCSKQELDNLIATTK